MVNRTAFPGTATNTTHLASEDNSLPGGWLGYAEITADSATFAGTLTDIAGLSQPVTVNTSRRIKISFDLQTVTSVANDVVDYFIREGTTTLKSFRSPQYGTGASQLHMDGSVSLTPTSGSHTYKISGQRTSGTGNHNVNAAASGTAPGPAFILIEDLGPA